MRTKYVTAFILWFLIGGIDFWTGFVEFSPLRLFLLILIAAFMLPFSLPSFLERLRTFFPRYGGWRFALLAVMAVSGYALFFARYMRGANMADDPVFKEVIEQTARGCFLCYPPFGESYFAGHNNLFLVLFVPLTVFPFWWLIVHFVHSVVIVIWCRIGGWAWGGNTRWGWYVAMALFLATYTQHGAFYDARFAALGLAVFAAGYFLQRKRLMIGGVLSALPARETSGLTLFMFGLVGALTKPYKKFLLAIALTGLLWWLGSYALMLHFGGPIVPRFDPCLSLNLDHLPDVKCAANLLTTDWQLKLAYTLRLVRFAPTLGALPSLFAALPDLGLTWLSKDNVLYSLGWHYYMQSLGILIVGAGLAMRQSHLSEHNNSVALRWIIASGLWQFATTMRPNLY